MSSHCKRGSYMSWHNGAKKPIMTDNMHSSWTFRDSTDLCMCTHLRLLRDIYKAGVSGAHADKALSGRRARCGIGCGELNTHTHTHTHKMNINIALGAVQLLRGRIDTDNAHVWWEILFIMKNTEDKLSHAWETRDTLRTGSSVECVWDGRWWAVVLTWRGGGVAASLSGGGGRFGVWQGQGHGSRHRGRRRRRQHGGGQERVVKLPLTTPVGLDRKRTEKTWKQTPSINGTLDTYDQQAQQMYHTRARQENVLSNFLLLIAIKKICCLAHFTVHNLWPKLLTVSPPAIRATAVWPELGQPLKNNWDFFITFSHLQFWEYTYIVCNRSE